jgi:Flp pilus assembly protein TadB
MKTTTMANCQHNPLQQSPTEVVVVVAAAVVAVVVLAAAAVVVVVVVVVVAVIVTAIETETAPRRTRRNLNQNVTMYNVSLSISAFIAL